MKKLQERYNEEVVAKLKEEFSITNENDVPRIEKVVINTGLGKSIMDSRFTDVAVDVLKRITGQQPMLTKARKSISNFKIREGMVIGAKVTLRGEMMYAFLDKLVHVALPRVRDFQGVKRTFDKQGNYTLGLSEHTVFPEISSDDVETIVGLEITVVTSAKTPEQGDALLTQLGFPFVKNDKK